MWEEDMSGTDSGAGLSGSSRLHGAHMDDGPSSSHEPRAAGLDVGGS